MVKSDPRLNELIYDVATAETPHKYSDSRMALFDYIYEHHTCVQEGCDHLAYPGSDYCPQHDPEE
jgi:hypothetical protein